MFVFRSDSPGNLQSAEKNIVKKLIWRFYPGAHSCRREPEDESHCKVKR